MTGRVKAAFAAALHGIGAQATLGRLREGGAPLIVGYHRIVEDYRATAAHALPAMLTSLATLERHLDWLARHYRIVTLSEAAASWTAGLRQGTRPVAAVTFDDGYRDFYETAFPILVRKGIPAAVFVVTELVGTSGLQLHDELYLLLKESLRQRPGEALAPLAEAAGADPALLGRIRAAGAQVFRLTRLLLEDCSQSQLRRLLALLRERVAIPEQARAGLQSLDWSTLSRLQRAGVTVGSHTRTHALLVNEPLEKVIEEVARSKSTAEAQLGEPLRHFAYPDGQFNPAVMDAVERAGYHYAYTFCRHCDPARPRLTVPRLLLWERSLAGHAGSFSPMLMSGRVNGLLEALRGCRRPHGALLAAR